MTIFFLLIGSVLSEVMYLAVTLPVLRRRFDSIDVGDQWFFGFFFFIGTGLGIIIQLMLILICVLSREEKRERPALPVDTMPAEHHAPHCISIEQASDEYVQKMLKVVEQHKTAAWIRDIILAEARRRGMTYIDPKTTEHQLQTEIWY